jgi:hypothetical protein
MAGGAGAEDRAAAAGSTARPTAEGEIAVTEIVNCHGNSSRIHDDGPNQMHNVILNENPIRKELGYGLRTNYGKYQVIYGPTTPGVYENKWDPNLGIHTSTWIGGVPEIKHGR